MFSTRYQTLEEITGQNDFFTPLQFLFTNCHPDFSIFPPKTHLEEELRLCTRIVSKSLLPQGLGSYKRNQLIFYLS